MAFLNEEHLNQLLTNRSSSEASIINEQFRRNDNRVFLSYRHQDRQFVLPIVSFLQQLGIEFYIDYLDPILVDSTKGTTAATLRMRIEESNKLIQIITPNIGSSRWMPWELGLGDGLLGYEKTITLPLINEFQQNIDRDYLAMYGYIETAQSKDKTRVDWAVRYPDRPSIWLSDWLMKN